MTATSSETSWCTVSVSGNKITLTITENKGNKRTANVYATYRNCQSQIFTVTQQSAYDPFETVTIGGVQWTQYNLANPFYNSSGGSLTGSFATKKPSQCTGKRDESHGKFYQFKRNVAWNSTGSLGTSTPSGNSWQTTTPASGDWTTSPCPSGFRLPTNTEFANLINGSTQTNGGGWTSSDYGYKIFTSGGVTLEFPAVGLRSYSNGALDSYGTSGRYWSYVQDGTSNAYNMNITSGTPTSKSTTKGTGRSIRCVRQ